MAQLWPTLERHFPRFVYFAYYSPSSGSALLFYTISAQIVVCKSVRHLFEIMVGKCFQGPLAIENLHAAPMAGSFKYNPCLHLPILRTNSGNSV